MKVLSLFSGIGAFEKALGNLGIAYDLVAYCDFDKYASKSYAAIHGIPETKNIGDITKVDEKKLGMLDIKGMEQVRRVYGQNGIAPTLSTMQGGNRQPKVSLSNGLRIRKLTPKECFRLMGFDDADFKKAESVNSNSQLYKQAGNSIVVPVVQGIIQGLIDCEVLMG